MNHRTTPLRLACLCTGLAFPATALYAQEFPAKALRIVVPFAAGASTDILARAVAQRYTEAFGQPAIVENRLGAGGTVGSVHVAKSPPDGYTLLMATTSTHAIAPHALKSVPYDPAKDFAAVSLVTWVPTALLVHPSLPVRSVKELIALARARPGQLQYSSSGTGTLLHLCGAVFASMAGIDMLHIPYKGAAPALTDLAGGQVQLMFSTIASSSPFVQSGRLRALALAEPRRSAAMPDLPTIAEAGLPGYAMSNWIGLVAPARTPKDVVAKLSGEAMRFARIPENRDKFRVIGAELEGNSAEAFGAFIAAEQPRYAKILRDAGIRPE
jgi:tripartite-type tricarboxylate transporter receptor subunit TctC